MIHLRWIPLRFPFNSHNSVYSPVQVPLQSWTIYPREGLFLFYIGVHLFVNLHPAVKTYDYSHLE
jgi:hypothetical protein